MSKKMRELLAKLQAAKAKAAELQGKDGATLEEINAAAEEIRTVNAKLEMQKSIDEGHQFDENGTEITEARHSTDEPEDRFASVDYRRAFMMESIEYGEKDGTNDVYATLTMREKKILTAVKSGTTSVGSSKTRSLSTAATQTKADNCTVTRGDTLSGICRKYYGDSSLSTKLAKYNGIKNASLIRDGQIIKLPAKSQL